MKYTFCFIINLMLIFQLTSGLTCRNGRDQPTDWWVIFKMPYLRDINPTGLMYFYCDSSNDCQNLELQGDLLNQANSSPLFQTVRQVNKQDLNQVFLSWSDQPFGKSDISNHGHSKGLLALDSKAKTGFVINHSLPKFPVVDLEGNILLALNDNSKDYGQQFFCFTATSDTIEQMAPLYSTAEVRTSYFNFPVQLEARFPNLSAMKNNKVQTLLEMKLKEFLKLHHQVSQHEGILKDSTRKITSIGGLQIEMFSKSPSQLVDFYESIISPSLRSPVFTETWGDGAGGLDSPKCGEFHVQSNMYIFINNAFQYRYTKDHSKYAISQKADNPFICMSDLNRQLTQYKRGGTGLCFINKNIWNHVRQMFTEQQQC